MVFEIGKAYKHTTGHTFKVVSNSPTTLYGNCLVAEENTGKLLPVGRSEDNAVNYKEITEEEWMSNFTE